MKNRKIRVVGYWNETPNQLFSKDCMVGTRDGVSNDDHIFFWFDQESKVLGDQGDFFVLDYSPKKLQRKKTKVSSLERFATKIIERYIQQEKLSAKDRKFVMDIITDRVSENPEPEQIDRFFRFAINELKNSSKKEFSS